MTTTRQMLERYRAALAVDHGGGYDLSGTGSVMVGLYDAPPIGQRFVSLFPGPSTSAEWLSLREPRFRQSVIVTAWEPVNGHGPASRIDAALALGEVVSGAVYGIWLGSNPPNACSDPQFSHEVLEEAVLSMGLTSHALMAMESSYLTSGALGVV